MDHSEHFLSAAPNDGTKGCDAVFTLEAQFPTIATQPTPLFDDAVGDGGYLRRGVEAR